MKRLGFLLVVALLAVMPSTVCAATQQEIEAKEKEVAKLDQKIKELTGDSQQVAGEVAETKSQVEELRRQLSKARLELQRTQATIETVAAQEEKTTEDIGDLQENLEEQRAYLRHLIRTLYQQEQGSLIRTFFSNFSVSEVMAAGAALEDLQEQVAAATKKIHEQLADLSSKQESLQEQQTSLTQLQKTLAVQQEEITDQEKAEQAELVSQTAEESRVNAMLAEAKQAREEIANQIFSLKSSNIQVTLGSASDMARNAGTLTGVRPALVMAVLKVESNLGNNVGSGVFPDDMQPASRDAFIRITDKLGLDRSKAQISRRPSNGKGWGGAIGPSQFMPATWEGIEGRVEALMKKSPVNPYELSDAFVGTAVYLADRGAARGAEREALARYVSGPYWEYHVNGWYVERVLAVAAEYEKEF
ncbi:MAG: hypothetical protein HYR90_04595 [Candidatus Andersenbacteria bacterium]|nr:hypothetical protein [Candidatus Andersenbacteria bacterium]MBI3250449.1 hypothetical protein [Candidatus Andersenbacteria bacterium]